MYSGAAHADQTYTVTVGDFTMGTPSPSSISMVPGASVTVTETIQGVYGFTGTVYVYCDQTGLIVTGCPANVTVPGALTFTVQAPTGTGAKLYTITIKGNDPNHTVPLQVFVTGNPAITMSSPIPSPAIVASSQNVTFNQTVTAVNGFTGTVGFTVPSNVLCRGRPGFDSRGNFHGS